MTQAHVSAARTRALSCPAACCLTHFVSDVDLAEAEGAEVGVGHLHGRLDGLVEELLHQLTDVGPHLSDRLRGRKRKKNPNPDEEIVQTRWDTQRLRCSYIEHIKL